MNISYILSKTEWKFYTWFAKQLSHVTASRSSVSFWSIKYEKISIWYICTDYSFRILRFTLCFSDTCLFKVFAFPFVQFFWSMTTAIVVFVSVKVGLLVLGQVKYLNRSLSSPAKVECSQVYAVRLQHTAHLQHSYMR